MPRPPNVQKFIDEVTAQAQAVSRATGLPTSVIVAQAGVETRWGTRVVGNAYFGVKANSAYYECQAKVKFQTKEVQPGLSGVHTFCAYKNFFDAAMGYAKFIESGPQFEKARQVKNEPLKYAAAVADGGYAGGQSKEGREAYKKLLFQVINDFDLLELDRVIYVEPVVITAEKPG